MIDGFAEEVIGVHGAGDVVAGTVVALRLAVLRGEVDGDAEFGQDITLDVERKLGGGDGRVAVAHERVQMLVAEIYFVGQG